MIATEAKKLAGRASTALEAMIDAVRHLAWYVSYRVEGGARDQERRPGDGN